VLAFRADAARTARSGAQARALALSFDRRVQVARYMDVFRSVVVPHGKPAAVAPVPRT
jgi:hypothetical protein